MKQPDNTSRALLALTGLTVTGLACVAGAISFSHMATLAVRHGQTGWQAGAFPVSVDGLELVASLYLVAQHRAGRRVGSLPWAALVVGTAASLAANIAVGGHDLIGRALAGWPAISLLVSVKLLFSMFDHGGGDRAVVRDDQRTVPDETVARGTVPVASRLLGGLGTDEESPTPTRRQDFSAEKALPASDGRAAIDLHDVAYLMPAARAARAALATDGQRLSRDALARRMRNDGHPVSSARATSLLRILKSEGAAASLNPASAAT